jgi:hypothetical protein
MNGAWAGATSAPGSPGSWSAATSTPPTPSSPCPALVYAVGAYGFFALPYTILVYPIVFMVMPKLWHAAHKAGHVTAADVVYGRYGSRALELAIAVTGVVATMPYIALQLVGMEVVIKALGLTGELPLAAPSSSWRCTPIRRACARRR